MEYSIQKRLNIVFERSIRERAIKVAPIVGTLLVMINHGDALLSGSALVNQHNKLFFDQQISGCMWVMLGICELFSENLSRYNAINLSGAFNKHIYSPKCC